MTLDGTSIEGRTKSRRGTSMDCADGPSQFPKPLANPISKLAIPLIDRVLVVHR